MNLVTLESDPEEGPYIPASMYKRTYQLMRNGKKKDSEDGQKFPLSFMEIRKRIGLFIKFKKKILK